MDASRSIQLLTADGVRLHASWWKATDTAVENALVVFVPGFTGHGRVPAVRRLVTRLRRRTDLLVLELRGHGRSSGASTLGAREATDVDAALRWGRAQGYQRIATVGFSFGAGVVICHAGLHGGVDAVAAVSAPSRWYIRDTPKMRALHVMVESSGGRLFARLWFKVRLAGGWRTVPPSPLEVVHRIAPTPLLIVHGDADHYFPIEHPLALAAAAGEGCQVWLEPGFSHAENQLSPALADRLAAWLARPLAAGGQPADRGRPDRSRTEVGRRD